MRIPRLPPTTPGPETEGLLARARRDTERVRKSWLARGIVAVLDLALGVVVAEVLVSAKKPGLGVALLTVLALAGGPFAAIGVAYVFQLFAAPFRQRREWRTRIVTERGEAQARWQAERDAFDAKWKECEDLRGQLGASENELRELRPRLEAAEAKLASKPIDDVAPLLGTELRDIRIKIERVKATNPPSYPRGFQLPGDRFREHSTLLAERPELYAIIERAYTAAHHVNENLRTRESRQGPGHQPLLRVIPQDGLDRAHALAGEALDALNQHHNEPIESPAHAAARAMIDEAIASGEIAPPDDEESG